MNTEIVVRLGTKNMCAHVLATAVTIAYIYIKIVPL